MVADKTYRRTRTGRRRTRTFLYATWRVGGTPVAVRDTYRTRFGVESSYRQLGQVRPRTSTPDGVIRLLWVAVGLILRNAWIRFGAGTTRGWTLTAACLVLVAEALAPPTASPSTTGSGAPKTRSPT